MEEISDNNDTFKKPELTNEPHVFKKPIKPSSHEILSEKESIPCDKETEIENKANEKTGKKKEKSLISVPLPYEEPEWHGHPPPSFCLEIIKNGTFISNMPIKSSLVVFGRLDVCDVVFEHPSVSRYHAVIQYCKGDDTHPKGFYLYDLGSTHGTFLNKEKIKSKIYYKLKVGYIVKFGGSSRLHIFQGPEEEEEEKVNTKVKEQKESEDEGCSWGMAEEADEEDDLAENPYALSAPNEELYIDDPKKTLRGWFEREGYEVEYKVEEKGFRTFCCTVQLPVDNADGEFLAVEASVSGKKKEAVIACALEACRTLDRMGLLRQSHQESRHRKRKKWEENDFYDSDEDTFYDRTGEIEKRREMRKRLAKKVEVDNFESLSVKLEKLNAEMEGIKNKISSKANELQNSATSENDPLDSYMSNLAESGNSISDKFERRKLKLRLMELEKEKLRLEKLSDIARPATLPPLSKHAGYIGKKISSKLKLPPSKPMEVVKLEKSENEEQIEENDSDDDKIDASETKVEDSNNEGNNTQSKKYGLILKPVTESETQKMEVMECDSEEVKVTSLKDLSPKNETAESNIKSNVETSLSQSSDTLEKDKIVIQEVKQVKPIKSSKKKEKSSKCSNVDVYKTSTTEYCTWMPPSDQSGDGITRLNEKYGY